MAFSMALLAVSPLTVLHNGADHQSWKGTEFWTKALCFQSASEKDDQESQMFLSERPWKAIFVT